MNNPKTYGNNLTGTMLFDLKVKAHYKPEKTDDVIKKGEAVSVTYNKRSNNLWYIDAKTDGDYAFIDEDDFEKYVKLNESKSKTINRSRLVKVITESVMASISNTRSQDKSFDNIEDALPWAEKVLSKVHTVLKDIEANNYNDAYFTTTIEYHNTEGIPVQSGGPVPMGQGVTGKYVVRFNYSCNKSEKD